MILDWFILLCHYNILYSAITKVFQPVSLKSPNTVLDVPLLDQDLAISC